MIRSLMKKATSKRKGSRKTKSKTKHSLKLVLSGERPNYSRFKVKKNQPRPITIHSSVKKWDHFIALLDNGDEMAMDKSEACSFANRSRNLGYVVVMRKRGEDEYLVWFGGLKK